MKVPKSPALSQADMDDIALKASMFPGSTITGVSLVPNFETWAVELNESRRPKHILIGEGSLEKFTKPMWSAATYHEAAHSSVTYFTPKSADWPKDLCHICGNILEDARMEKDIEIEYPGTIPSFELLNTMLFENLKKESAKDFKANTFQIRKWEDIFNAMLILKLGRFENSKAVVVQKTQEIEMPNKTKRTLNLEDMWKDASEMMDEYINQPCGFFEPESLRKSSNRYATNKISAFLDKYGWVARNEMEKAKEFAKMLKEALKKMGMGAMIKGPGQPKPGPGQPGQSGPGKDGKDGKDGKEPGEGSGGKDKDKKDPQPGQGGDGKEKDPNKKDPQPGQGQGDGDGEPEDGLASPGSHLEEAERTPTKEELEKEIHDLLQEMAPRPGGNGYCNKKLGSLFQQDRVKTLLAEVNKYFPVSPPPGAGYRFEQTTRKRFRATDGDLDFDAVVAWHAANKPKGMMLAKDSVANRKSSGELHHPPPHGKDFPIKRIAIYLDLSGSMYRQVTDMIAFSAAFSLFARKHKIDIMFVVGDQGNGLVKAGNPQNMHQVLEKQMGNSGNEPTWTTSSMQEAYKWAKEKGRIIFITDRAIRQDELTFIDKVVREKFGICTNDIDIKEIADLLWMRQKSKIKQPDVDM